MKKKVFDKIFFERAFSEARMRPYYRKYPGNAKKAELHYKQNIQLAESLVPSLSVFEVSLRNALIRELERMSGQKDWYRSFQSNVRLKPLYRYVQIASMHIQTRGESISPDKINGELTLGFWVSLFNAEYEKTLWKGLRLAFPSIPKGWRQRKNVSAPLNAIRSLRNRVFHHEAISWNLSRLTELHQLITKVIGWIDPSLQEWLKKTDRFESVVRRIRIRRRFW